MSNVMYFFTFNIQLSAVQISACLLGRSLLGIAFIPIVGRLSIKFDKRIALIICYTVGIAGMIIMKLIGLHDLAGAAVYIIFLTIAQLSTGR